MTNRSQLFDQRLAALRAVPGLAPTHVTLLAETLSDPDPYRAFRLNPLRFSAQHGLPAELTLDLFLHATRVGLLELRFNLVCPGCGGIEYQARQMDGLPPESWHCIVCQRSIPSELDDRVEVSFTPEVGVRDLDLDPFESAERYMRFYFSENFERAAPVQAVISSLTSGVHLVPPGSEVSFTLAVEAGATYRLLSLDTHSQLTLTAAPNGATTVEAAALEKGLSPGALEVAAGARQVRVVNRGTAPVGFLVTKTDWDALSAVLAAHPSRMHPFLTARRLLNSQTFRELFRVQSLDPNLRLRLRSITLLFTDLKGSTELYDRTGDLRAYAFVRDHFKVLAEAVKRHRGAIIKTMGDAIMASFDEPSDAALAAVEMMRGMDALNEALHREGHETGLKVGLHEGPALAVMSEERLDYFGQTVNVAARVQGLAQAGEIWLTPPVLGAAGVAQVLAQSGWHHEPRRVSLKGVGGQTDVHRLFR